MNKLHSLFLGGLLAATESIFPAWSQETSKPTVGTTTRVGCPLKNSEVLSDFQVIEFRRYIIRDGQREHFAKYFETYFPEAFQQLGAVAVGQFLNRGDNSRFTWLRAFHNMDDRAKANASFYYGPVWREHSMTLNSLMIDSDNVLLLRPLSPERGIAILPAVNPVKEATGARGIAVAQIFAVKTDNVDVFAKQAESAFVRYREVGACEVAVLVSLDKPNNFPQLPVRTDGPYLVWLGIVEDEQALKTLTQRVGDSQQALSKTDLLRAPPELIILDPTSRSRLRWITNN